MRTQAKLGKGTTPPAGVRALFFVRILFLMAWFVPPVAVAAAPAPQQKTGSKASASKSSSSKPAKKKRTTRRRARGQAAPTAERVKEIQSALAREGHYTGAPSGKWDSATVEALKRFQTAQDLKATGKLDAKTLQALGLGSEVAGLAPPRESTPAASSPQ
jgi:peptidoglycan hydrolase-like protein with peptidoglycan-binding domain